MKTADAIEFTEKLDELMAAGLAVTFAKADNGGTDLTLTRNMDEWEFNQGSPLAALKAAVLWVRHKLATPEPEKTPELMTVQVDHLPGMPVQLRKLNQDATVREISVLGAQPNHVIQYRVTYWANNEQKSEWVYPDQLKP